jgi:pyruvate dehydrogenase (quinone)
VRHLFGYPGDGINGVFGALNRADGKIGFVQARHEEMAAFMATAYAKFSEPLPSPKIYKSVTKDILPAADRWP